MEDGLQIQEDVVSSILHPQSSILASLREQPSGRVKFLAQTASDS